jgi:hypothetical protein
LLATLLLLTSLPLLESLPLLAFLLLNSFTYLLVTFIDDVPVVLVPRLLLPPCYS